MGDSTAGDRALHEGSQRAFAVAQLGGKEEGSFLLRLTMMHLDSIPLTDAQAVEIDRILETERKCA